MSELEIIKSKLDKDVNAETIVKRLKKELQIEEELLYTIILDVIIIILDYTNQDKIIFSLTTTLINMIKDYYYLNYNKDANSNTESENNDLKIKSIVIGDTTTTFVDKSSQITINGTTYNTGTIDFSNDILIDKYAVHLNRHRKMRWK